MSGRKKRILKFIQTYGVGPKHFHAHVVNEAQKALWDSIVYGQGAYRVEEGKLPMHIPYSEMLKLIPTGSEPEGNALVRKINKGHQPVKE